MSLGSFEWFVVFNKRLWFFCWVRRFVYWLLHTLIMAFRLVIFFKSWKIVVLTKRSLSLNSSLIKYVRSDSISLHIDGFLYFTLLPFICHPLSLIFSWVTFIIFVVILYLYVAAFILHLLSFKLLTIPLGGNGFGDLIWLKVVGDVDIDIVVGVIHPLNIIKLNLNLTFHNESLLNNFWYVKILGSEQKKNSFHSKVIVKWIFKSLFVFWYYLTFNKISSISYFQKFDDPNYEKRLIVDCLIVDKKSDTFFF